MSVCVCVQCRLEGGFQGRTNKLVDSCYSYWQVRPRCYLPPFITTL